MYRNSGCRSLHRLKALNAANLHSIGQWLVQCVSYWYGLVFGSGTDLISLSILLLLFFLFLFLLWRPSSKSLCKGSVVSNGIGMTYGTIVLQVNTHRLTKLDFRYDVIHSEWWPWCHFTLISAAIWWVYAHKVSARRICSSIRQFLIHSTSVLFISCFRSLEDVFEQLNYIVIELSARCYTHWHFVWFTMDSVGGDTVRRLPTSLQHRHWRIWAGGGNPRMVLGVLPPPLKMVGRVWKIDSVV